MVSNVILGQIVKKLIFLYITGGHLGFGPLEKNAGPNSKGRGAKFFIKGL